MRATPLSLLVAPLLFVAPACKKAPPVDERPPAQPASSSVVSAAALDAGPSAAPTAGACPPVDKAKVAAYTCDKRILAADVPALVDPDDTLAPFYDRVLALARGKATEHVKIGMYGDSNLTADALTGHMRRILQARFGDGGHGYVALSQPWEWYSHNDVHHDGKWKLFRQIATSTMRVKDNQYGFANIASESATVGAAAWISTTEREAAKIGKTVSRFDVYFAKRPDGGRFDLELDKTFLRTVDTRADAWDAGFERVDTTDGPHELRVVIKGHGPVRLYGMVLEREPKSIQVDSLGTGALNLEQMLFPRPETRDPQLARRAYDLVIVHLGTNMFGTDKDNRKHAKELVAAFRKVRPGVPFLFMSPPDHVPDGATKTEGRIVTLSKTMKTVAAENAAAFWDFREAMGGDASMLEFIKKGLAERDRIHLKKQGDEIMGERMVCALWDGLGAYLEKHPDAGCAEPAKP